VCKGIRPDISQYQPQYGESPLGKASHLSPVGATIEKVNKEALSFLLSSFSGPYQAITVCVHV
jgi:hypothetical protein